jgi:hypothetical protein
LRVIHRAKVALAFSALGAGFVAVSAVPARAQSDSKAILIQDFRDFIGRCQPANSAPVASQACTNERNELTERQKKLNVSDDDLRNAGLNVRGHLGDRKD